MSMMGECLQVLILHQLYATGKCYKIPRSAFLYDLRKQEKGYELELDSVKKLYFFANLYFHG